MAAPYSAARHLAKVIWLSEYSEENTFGMFALTSYFDASYDNPKTITIVSGWTSTTGLWERFDADWKLLLAKNHIPYLHMREFAHSVKGSPFEDWKGQENKRANFLRAAVDIIGSYVRHGFACVVEHEAFKQVDVDYMLSEAVGNPYALAGRDCIAHANVWLKKDERELPVEYFFEDGDEGKRALERIVKRDHHLVPYFGPSRDTKSGQKGLTPLQAADFAAYEILKGSKLGENAPLWKYRRSLHELAKIPAWWGQYQKDDLLRFCEVGTVPRRGMFRT